MAMEQSGGNQWDGKRPDPITRVKEGWYDKLLARVPLTVKSLNVIIAILFILLVAALVIGVIKGRAG